MLLRIDFGKKDMDLKRWKISAQMAGYSIKTLICQMIRADLQGTGIILPPIDEEVSIKSENLSLKFQIRDIVVENHLISLPIYSRSAYIKSLIRKNITLNSGAGRKKKAENCPTSTLPLAEKRPFYGKQAISKNNVKSAISGQNTVGNSWDHPIAEKCPQQQSKGTDFCPHNTSSTYIEDENIDVKSAFIDGKTNDQFIPVNVAEKSPFSEVTGQTEDKNATTYHTYEDEPDIEFTDNDEEDSVPDMGMLFALAGE